MRKFQEKPYAEVICRQCNVILTLCNSTRNGLQALVKLSYTAATVGSKGRQIWLIMTSPVVPSERGIVAFRPSGDQIAQCPTESNNGVLYKIYIYLHQYTTHHSSRVLVSTARHPNIDYSLTSSYRHTARSVAVRHTSWLRPLRPFH